MSITTIGAIILFCLACLLYRKVNKRSQARMGLECQKVINMAVEGLAKTDEDGAVMISRVTALHSLIYVTQTHYSFHSIVTPILCAYIRKNSPNTDKTDEEKDKQSNPEPMREDILLALDIIRNRNRNWFARLIDAYASPTTIDLRNCDLHFASFGRRYDMFYKGAHLNGAMFNGSNLTGAAFNELDMTNAYMHDANMTEAKFWETNLSGTTLGNSNLTDAYIRDTNLTDAKLRKANMMNAETSGAYAHEGDLSECKNLIQEQLDVMFCGIKVKIPEGLTRPEHWPTKYLSYKKFIKAYKEQHPFRN